MKNLTFISIINCEKLLYNYLEEKIKLYKLRVFQGIHYDFGPILRFGYQSVKLKKVNENFKTLKELNEIVRNP